MPKRKWSTLEREKPWERMFAVFEGSDGSLKALDVNRAKSPQEISQMVDGAAGRIGTKFHSANAETSEDAFFDYSRWNSSLDVAHPN